MGCVASGQTAANAPRLPSKDSTCVEEDPVKVAALVDMGVSEKIAREALQACNNDLDKAAQDATERTAAEAAKCFQDAQQILVEAQTDLEALEAKTSGASNGKELARLADVVTRASCTLDGISVTGNSELRNARREQLGRCDNLEERIQALRVAETKQVVGDAAHTEACEEIPDLPAGQSISISTDVAMPTTPSAAASVASQEPAAAASSTVTAAPAMSPGTSVVSQEPAAAASSTVTAAPAMSPGTSGPKVLLPTDMRIAGAECMRLAGNTAFKEGDFEVAAARYREALALDDEDTAILSNLAAAELRLGQFAAAAQHASAADRFSGGFSAKALFRKGQALQGLGQIGEASAAFEAALALEPSDQMTKRCCEECRAASAKAVSTLGN